MDTCLSAATTPIQSAPFTKGFPNSLPLEATLALDRKGAARTLGISTITLDRLVSRGVIRVSRATRKPLFSVRELNRFLDTTIEGKA